MHNFKTLFAIIVLFLFSFLNSLYASERIALVVGNSDYINVSQLANPGSDAALMTSTLESVGFEVTLVSDADLRGLRKALTEFGRKLRENDAVGLFYYAGHGVQMGGENFLIPVDANIQDESELSWQAIRVNDVLRVMERESGNMNIVILDSCRNNPFPSASRSSVAGLASIDASEGTFIAYATAPGEVALDGDTKNSPYTLALASAISTAGLSIEETFKSAREEVLIQTEGRQTPWEASSITGSFHFISPTQESIATLQAKLKEQQKLIDGLKEKQFATASPSKADSTSGPLCDALASSPLDSNVVGQSVAYSTLRTHAKKAVAACEQAVEAYPKDDHYKYQLARSYLASGDKQVDAAHWMRKAADGYYPAAMNGIGVLLNLGRGVAKDDAESFSWITKAAEKGYVPAMTNLGIAYAYGGATPVDPFQATKWLQKSVSQNDPYAKMHLGLHRAQGNKALIKDVPEAIKLLDQAIATGANEATYLKLQVYGFAILDGSSDRVRKQLQKQSKDLGIRGAFIEEYYSYKKLNLLKSAVALTPRHELQEYEPLYTSSVYFDSEPQFRSTLDWLIKSNNYPKSHRDFLAAYLQKNKN